MQSQKNLGNSKHLPLKEGMYLKFSEEKMDFTACDTEENFSKYMETFRGDTRVNHIKGLVANGNCVLLNNHPKSEYFIKISALNKEKTRVSQIIQEDFFGNEIRYFTDIKPSENILSIKRPSSSTYTRYKNIIDKYNRTKKGKEISFDMGRLLCKSRKIFLDGFMNDKMDFYEDTGKCLRIKSGTKLRYGEIGPNLTYEYIILSGDHKGQQLYGF